MSEADILDLLRRERALLEGHFQLSSGLHSDRYFQCALALADPKNAEHLASKLAAKFAGQSFDLVVGPALGAVIWAHEVARALGLRCYFTERKEGQMVLRRGFAIEPGQRILLVEDVVTTGGSSREVIECLKQHGGEVTGMGCLVNRSGGNPFSELGLELKSLADVNARTWDPSEPPEEFRTSQPIKPGSRPGA